jgi:hypothetical protein
MEFNNYFVDNDEINGYERGLKRNSDIIDSDKKQKRRFVWPDTLHREFISAVFDVGLSYATSDALEDMLPVGHNANKEQIGIHVSKLRLYRNQIQSQPVDTVHQSAPLSLSKSVLSFQNQINMGSTSKYAVVTPNTTTQDISPKNLHDNRERHVEGVNHNNFETVVDSRTSEVTKRLQQELRSMRNAIFVQTEYMSSLRTSIQSQARSFNSLLQKMQQLDPALGPINGYSALTDLDLFGNTNRSRHSFDLGPDHDLPQFGTSDMYDIQQGGQTVGYDVKSELQAMSSEMRSHMHMHRQLLVRREGQLQLHGAGLGRGLSGHEYMYSGLGQLQESNHPLDSNMRVITDSRQNGYDRSCHDTNTGSLMFTYDHMPSSQRSVTANDTTGVHGGVAGYTSGYDSPSEEEGQINGDKLRQTEEQGTGLGEALDIDEELFSFLLEGEEEAQRSEGL